MTAFFPLGNPVFVRISGRFGNRALLTVFMLLAACGALAMAAVPPSAPYWVVALVAGTANVGIGVTGQVGDLR